MVDGTKNNSIDDDLLNSSVDDETKYNDGVDKNIDDSNFLDELDDLQKIIKEVAGNKIQEREKEIVDIDHQKDEEILDFQSETLGGLDVLKSQISETKETKVSKFFEKGKEEFETVDTGKEKRFVKEHKKLKGISSERPEAVKKAIESSVDIVLDGIYNWKEEKNPVARSLLRIVNMIMKTEKKL